MVTEREFTGVLKAMQKLKIKVEHLNLVNSLQIIGQTTPRDIGFVIDSSCFKARSRFASRSSEHQGIDHLLTGFEKNVQVENPEKLFLEGGDVVIAPGLFLSA